MKPTLADFPLMLAFSRSIEEGALNPYLNDARLLDVLPILGERLLEDVELLPTAQIVDWGNVVLEEATPGLLATRRERVYKLLVPQPENNPPVDGKDTTEWEYQPLRTLWFHYAHEYWVQAAYSRFFNEHGVNVVKGGVTVPTDPQATFQPASPAQRASKQAAIDGKLGALRNRLTHFLERSTLLTATNETSTCSDGLARRTRRLRAI